MQSKWPVVEWFRAAGAALEYCYCCRQTREQYDPDPGDGDEVYTYLCIRDGKSSEGGPSKDEAVYGCWRTLGGCV